MCGSRLQRLCIRIYRLTTILKSLDIKPSKRQVKELTLSLSKLALLTSFVIFKCKDEPEWFEPKLIVE